MDPLVLAGIAGGYAGKKLLGPSLDVVGGALARWTEQRLTNVGRIVKNASAKIEEGSEGSVPARLAMRIFEEGSYSDEPIVVEYLGGVLASSRAPGGRDDRGVGWASLVTRLSSFELRMHYVFYTGAREALLGKVERLSDAADTDLFVPIDEWLRAMDLEPETTTPILQHSVYGLHREGLVGDTWGYGSAEELRSRWPMLEGTGVVARPSRAGMSLFLWGLGKGGMNLLAYLDPNEDFSLVDMDVYLPTVRPISGPGAEEPPTPPD